jgi:Polysaccharide deacetylase
MRPFFCLAALLLLLAAPGAARAADGHFVSVAFHDVVDRQEELGSDAITSDQLLRFFDWLKGNGWTPISFDDIEAARRGKRTLPEKAILLTFDDGYQSVYTRVFPLLLAYRYPAVVALTGAWMAGEPGSKVKYGDADVPRERFLSWPEVREMVSSGCRPTHRATCCRQAPPSGTIPRPGRTRVKPPTGDESGMIWSDRGGSSQRSWDDRRVHWSGRSVASAARRRRKPRLPGSSSRSRSARSRAT